MHLKGDILSTVLPTPRTFFKVAQVAGGNRRWLGSQANFSASIYMDKGMVLKPSASEAFY